MLDLLFCNPWRPVDAWWQRAVGFGDNGDTWPSGRKDSWRGNSWIRQAHRFRHALAEAGTYQDQLEVIIKYPAIYYAHWIFEQGTTNNRSIRWAIEARILARQSNEEIARKNGCSPDAIEAYESLYFNVRDRLNYRDFVLNSVLGQAAVCGIQPSDQGLLWKLVGYLAGPYVLDAMISHFPNPLWAYRQEDVPAFFQDAAINILKKKTAIAAMTVPVENHSHMHLIEAFVKYVEIERTTDSMGKAQDQIQENLQGLLESLPFTAVGIADAKRLQHYDTGAAELRTDELLITAIGGEIPGIERLQELRFPEQVPKQ
jgi:hypothetical protein